MILYVILVAFFVFSLGALSDEAYVPALVFFCLGLCTLGLIVFDKLSAKFKSKKKTNNTPVTKEKAIPAPSAQPKQEKAPSPWPKELLDDVSFIREMQHEEIGFWNVYRVAIDARPYGWENAVDWAEYMNVTDLEGVSEVCVYSSAGGAKDITAEYTQCNSSIKSMPSLEAERSGLSVGGISKTIFAPVKIVWRNQSRTLVIYTPIYDDDLLSRYVETAIRRSFNTKDAMKLGRPHSASTSSEQ